MSRLRVYLLGVPRAELDGISVSLGRQKAWALLAYLGATDAPHRREALAALLWPGSDETQARGSLRRVLATLTQVLPGPWWRADRASIALLNHPELWVDVREFRRLSRSLVSARPGGGDADLARLISLHRAGLLEGFTLRDSTEFDEWQYLEAAELQGIAVVALERQILRLHDAGAYGAALEHARRWLALDVLSEACHAWIMRLYAVSGHRTAALRQYQECERLLDRELGVAPQKATIELYRRIRDGAEGIDRVGEERAVTDVHARIGHDTFQAETSASARSLSAAGRSRLVGREREVSFVLDVLERTLAGDSRSLVIRGEPGMGKTRIAREAVLAGEDAGFLVLRGECAPEDRTPYACVAQIVRQVLLFCGEVARELPDHVLDDVLLLAPEMRALFASVEPNPTLNPRAEQLRLFDAFGTLCARLSRDQPLLLFLDDLHWVDPASLAMLRHALKTVGRERVSVIATVRDGEASANEALARWLAELERTGSMTSMRLGALIREHAEDLVRVLLDTEEDISEEFLDAVYRQTEGNPFFLEEMCKSMVERGDIYFAGGYWRRKGLSDIVLPERVRAAIMARVERLPEPARTLLRIASVLGQRFSLDTLDKVSTMSKEDMAEAFEQVEAMHFVRRQSVAFGTAFAFAHPLIPFAVRESMGPLRLQRSHLHVAEVLEASQGSTDPEALARHFLAGGDLNRGLEYTLQSAERSARLFAYESAIEDLHRALGLLGPAGDPLVRRRVLERLSDLYLLVGEHGQAIEALDAALEALRPLPPPSQTSAIRLHRKIIEAYGRISDRSENIRLAERVEASIAAGLQLVDGADAREEEALFFAALAKDPWDARAGRDREAAMRFARRAVLAAEQAGSVTTLSRALSALEASLGAQQRLREQVEVAGRRLALSRRADFTNRFERLKVLCESGAVLLRVGEYAQSLSLLLEAERLAGSMRAIDAHVYSVSLQAECLFYLDRWEEMLSTDEKRRGLVAQYGAQRVGRFCFYCGLAANVLAMQGRIDEARKRREEAHEIMSSTMGPVESWPRGGQYCRGNAFVGIGDYDLVRTELERALAAPASWVGDHDLYAILADIAVRQRSESDLRKYAPLAERSAADVGHRLYAAVADRAWGVLHMMTGDAAAAEPHLVRGLAAFRAYDAKWQMGRTLVALDELECLRGESDAGTKHLSEAIRLFDGLGATADGDQARRMLAARVASPQAGAP